MDPISFAILAFSTLAGGLISYGIDKYKTGLQQENEDKQLKLAEDNLDLNEKVSKQNYDLSVDQFNYQKELNDTLMKREDTAFQRQVSDLKAAGLSPLMVSGGASASPLTSAPAPQRDLSGFNTALSNMLGAYNDVYNRRLNRQQFSMQNRLQKAQFTANLLETANQIKKSKIEQSILNLDYKYYKDHPERNLGLQSVIINALENILNKNGSALPTGLPDIKLPGYGSSGLGLFDLGSGSKPVNIPDPVTFGIVNPSSKYGHTLDNENYDNNRKTSTLIKDEIKEKYYKNQIKTAIASDNDYSDLLPKLYKNDDYLKKHISLDNWKKAKEDFILYYLKYGQFEGHKKYFD